MASDVDGNHSLLLGVGLSHLFSILVFSVAVTRSVILYETKAPIELLIRTGLVSCRAGELHAIKWRQAQALPPSQSHHSVFAPKHGLLLTLDALLWSSHSIFLL